MVTHQRADPAIRRRAGKKPPDKKSHPLPIFAQSTFGKGTLGSYLHLLFNSTEKSFSRKVNNIVN